MSHDYLPSELFIVPSPRTPREIQIEKNTREKTAHEYAVRVSTLKRSASDKDDEWIRHKTLNPEVTKSYLRRVT